MRISTCCCWLGVVALFGCAGNATAADPAKDAAKDDTVSYHRQLRPILQQKCAGCHQPAKKRAGLLLLSYDDAKKGGDGGALWVAGKPNESLLIKSLKGVEDHKQMPDGEPPLSDEQI